LGDKVGVGESYLSNVRVITFFNLLAKKNGHKIQRSRGEKLLKSGVRFDSIRRRKGANGGVRGHKDHCIVVR